MMDHKDALTSYRAQVRKILQDHECNCRREAKKLHQLALIITERSHKSHSTLSRKLRSILQQEFSTFAALLARPTFSNSKSWEDVAKRLLHYKTRLNCIKGHIIYIDKTFQLQGTLTRSLEHLLVRLLLENGDSLTKSYKEACAYYICNSEDCGRNLEFIYKSIYEYEASEMLNKVTPNHELLSKLTNMGLTCLKEWRLLHADANFFDIYEIWQKYHNLSKLAGNTNSNLSAISTLFDDDPYKLLKSLHNVYLSYEDVNLLLSFSKKKGWKRSLEDAFVVLRNVTLCNGDFERLLQSILLSEYPSNNNDTFKFVVSIRRNFQQSVKNIKQFQTDMIRYLDFRLRKNYNEMRKNASASLSHSDHLWISAVTLLIVHYIPKRRDFLQRYLKEGLFRQILMLNSKYPRFFNHRASLQRHLIENLRVHIPMDVHPYLTLNNDALTSLDKTYRMNHNKTNFVGLYLSKHSYNEISDALMVTIDPIWPSIEFQREWTKQVDLFAAEDKILQGIFSLHSVTMSSPFRLAGGARLGLLVNLTMASIIYLFNDHDELHFREICKLLGSKEEAAIIRELSTLEKHKVLMRKNTNYFEINDSYIPTQLVAETGVIRCT